MGVLKTSCITVLLLGLAVEFGFCQNIPKMPNIVGFPSGNFGKGAPPKPAIDPSALAKAKSRLTAGSSIFALKNYCNLKRNIPYKDPSLRGMADPNKPSAGIPSAILNMALKRAGGAEANAVRALLDSSRKIQLSQARAKAATRNRTKRQTGDHEYLSDTVVTEMCTAREKRVMSVMNDGDLCHTIMPQEVKLWECASAFTRGVTNAFPFMQSFYCEPGNYENTAWYVMCRKPPTIRIHSALVPINCGCTTYKCNFEPYMAAAALDF